MTPADIGIDAARLLVVPGPGRVCAVFPHALYLRVPAGLVVLVPTRAPRGPLHLRVPGLPAVAPGCPIRLAPAALRIGDIAYRLDVPVWSPGLPPAASLVSASREARGWLPELCPTLDVGTTGRLGLPAGAAAALRGGDLLAFAGVVGGRGPGLTPVGDDILAGVLLVAHAMRGLSRVTPGTLLQCANKVPTNDIARAFLVCAARGRCIEPVHRLLTGLANADHDAVGAAVQDLRRFGSSSGVALTYGVRIALLELPRPHA